MSGVLTKQFKLVKEPTVKVVSHPILIKLAMGRIDRISVDARNVQTTNIVKFSQMNVDIRGLRFNLGSWVRRRRLSVETVDSAKVTIVISEKELNRYLVTVLPDSVIQLQDGKIRYNGKLGFLADGVKMDLRGKLRIGLDNNINFQPELVDINALPVAQEVKDYLKESLVVDYMIPELAGGFKVKQVMVEPDKLIVKGELMEFDFVTEGNR